MHWNKTSINAKQSKFDFLISTYHKKCYVDFVNERNIKAAKNSLDQTSSDEPFNYILKSLRNEEDKIWTSTELLEVYRSKGGSETNSTRFINRIKEYMTDEIYCFKAAGLATIVLHKKKASQVLKLVNIKYEDEALEIEKIAKKIKAKIKEVPREKEEYLVLDEEYYRIPLFLHLMRSLYQSHQNFKQIHWQLR